MALDANVLAELAFVKYQENMRAENPNVLKNRKTLEIPRDDGTVDYQFEDELGPIEIVKKDIMPLLLAVSEAVVEHLTEHAEIQSVSAGAVTRNIT